MLLQQTPQGIDARRARRHPLLADPVQPDQGLLLRPLDRHGGNPLHARRVHQRLGIGAVGLVPADERTHVVGRQQRHPVPVLLSEAPPVVRRAARFHHDPARPALRQKAHERSPAKSLPLGDLAALVRHRHLEHAQHLPMTEQIERVGNTIRVMGDLWNFHLLLSLIHHCTKKAGYSDIVLDMSLCTSAFQNSMLSVCAQVMGYRASGVEFKLVPPEDRGLQNLFRNTNWGHFLDPERYDRSNFRGHTSFQQPSIGRTRCWRCWSG